MHHECGLDLLLSILAMVRMGNLMDSLMDMHTAPGFIENGSSQVQSVLYSFLFALMWKVKMFLLGVVARRQRKGIVMLLVV